MYGVFKDIICAILSCKLERTALSHCLTVQRHRHTTSSCPLVLRVPGNCCLSIKLQNKLSPLAPPRTPVSLPLNTDSSTCFRAARYTNRLPTVNNKYLYPPIPQGNELSYDTLNNRLHAFRWSGALPRKKKEKKTIAQADARMLGPSPVPSVSASNMRVEQGQMGQFASGDAIVRLIRQWSRVRSARLLVKAQ